MTAMGTHPSRTLSVAIDRAPEDVYAFASRPENLPRWAFFDAIERQGDAWVARTPDGPVTIRFAERNTLGVIDHHVRVAPDLEVYVPLRVIANGTGSEVMLTVLRLPGTTDEAFTGDCGTVERDLAKLKELLESAVESIELCAARAAAHQESARAFFTTPARR